MVLPRPSPPKSLAQHKFVQVAIDNGFNVTRVRLVSKDGQVFEDTVQDSLVLFAATQEQEIQLPMQAELYNSKGELVWRETVLDNRTPAWLKFRKQ